jgi:hypothetical protein
LFGDHSQRPLPRPSGRRKNHCAIIPNHRQTNNRHWKILIVASHYWFDIANSQLATNLDITVDAAMTNVFYRLRKP